MKQTPDEQRLIGNMAPGVLCREGFLGGDGRPLAEILDTDNATVQDCGLTHQQIAERLGEILDAAARGLGREVRIGDHLAVCHAEAMGRIPCPWGACGVFHKGEVQITDSRGGRGVLFTPLSVHMIDDHGFYQGRGSRYRLEPRELARLLDLAPADR